MKKFEHINIIDCALVSIMKSIKIEFNMKLNEIWEIIDFENRKIKFSIIITILSN